MSNKLNKLSNKKLAALCIALLLVVAAVFVVGVKYGNTSSASEEPVIIYSESTNSVMIETPYGNLQYPEKWKGSIRTEVIEDAGSTIVKFYGTVGEYEEQHLFDVCFGGTGEIPVGAITDGDATTEVGVTYGQPDTEDWSMTAADTIYAMQDDMNYVIMQMDSLEGFEAGE